MSTGSKEEQRRHRQWQLDPRTARLQEDLKNAQEVIKLLAEWRLPEDADVHSEPPTVYCKPLH